MHKRTLGVCLFVCAVASCVPAVAAEKGQIGLAGTSSSTSQVGVIWHLSRHVAVVPSFAISRYAMHYDCIDSSCVSDPDTHVTFAANLGLRYLFAPDRAMSPYVGARLHPASGGFDGSAALGLHYSITRHVAVFGDMGVELGRSTHDGPDSLTHSPSWSYGTYRSAIGAVLYLN